MNFLKYQMPALLWMGVIFFLSSFPSSAFPVIPIPQIDKAVHAGIFFILCALIDRAIHHQNRFPEIRKYHLLISLSVVILYGLSDEYHQSFVPGRDVDIFDAMADTAGGLLYVMLWSFFKRWTKRYRITAT